MELGEAIRHMMAASGIGPSELARRIGKERNAVNTILSRGTSPRLDTLQAMARAMGYSVVLRSDADEVTVDADR